MPMVYSRSWVGGPECHLYSRSWVGGPECHLYSRSWVGDVRYCHVTTHGAIFERDRSPLDM